tara:strand:+ start:592 stop:780 length:189 start_codon:yes stop_codon:yes gene_type:complete
LQEGRAISERDEGRLVGIQDQIENASQDTQSDSMTCKVAVSLQKADRNFSPANIMGWQGLRG